MLNRKLLLIILDGVPLRNWRRLFGNLEGWVDSGEALSFDMYSVLPSTSASCYASIHTGVSPQVHGCTGNAAVKRIKQGDIFSQVRQADGITGAVGHSFWSELFCRAPFDSIQDIEYDEPMNDAINYGRFHTMAGYNYDNQMTPCDIDLFASLTQLCNRFSLDYGLLHSSTLDSMGHRYGHDCYEIDKACFLMDEMLAPFILRWRSMGYEIIVTADHGQDNRGHHGGRDELHQHFALYYFGAGQACNDVPMLSQLQLAPTILSRLGLTIPKTMQDKPFLS